MARPTEEKKERTVKLRISEELYEEIASKGANLSETIRKILRNSFVPQNNDKNSEKIGVLPFGIKKEVLVDLDSMSKFMGGSVSEMLRLFDEALNNGAIIYENGKYVGIPDLDLDNFKDACHEKGVDPQAILDKATQGVKKGII